MPNPTAVPLRAVAVAVLVMEAGMVVAIAHLSPAVSWWPWLLLPPPLLPLPWLRRLRPQRRPPHPSRRRSAAAAG